MIKKSKNRGFTLIELLVVIAIISLLSSVVISSLSNARAKARDTQRIAILGQIRNALELYYNDNGYYPQSNCGWDCNDYRYGYIADNWNALAADLAPYIKTLNNDPINSACAPWLTNCYSFTYGNVGRNTYAPQYDLTAQLEDTGSPYRCAVRNYKFHFNNSNNWCGNYSSQIYEASN